MMQTQTWSECGRHGSIRSRLGRPRQAALREPAPEAETLNLQACNDKIFNLCLGYMGNASDARDLTQDTLAKALVHCGRDNPEHTQAWLMAVARNACLDRLRRRKTRGPQQPVSEFTAIDWMTPEVHAGREDEIRIVRKAISRLPVHLRQALVLREYGEHSYKEIGRALGIHPDSVKTRLNRARQAVLHFYWEEQK